MYTIKQAAARSGVPVQLLRAWERRYGVVEPVRASSGYRLYDEPAIARLRAMRHLIADGWSASTAAAHVGQLDDAAVAALLQGTPSGRSVDTAGRSRGGARSAGEDANLTAELLDAAAALDEAALEQVLDDMFARGSFEHVASELVMPALVAIGDGWESGRLDVAAEHAAAGAIQRRLGGSFLAAGTPRDDGAPILVGLPPGSRHDLGALAFATAARRAGLPVRYLGADLPVADWLDAAGRTAARAVVIGVVTAADVDSARDVAQALRGALPALPIYLGGRHSESVATTRLEPIAVLPPDLARSAAQLRQELVPG